MEVIVFAKDLQFNIDKCPEDIVFIKLFAYT
jgi:hypothetical protein